MIITCSCFEEANGDLNGHAVLDVSRREVRIRQLQLAVALCDVIRNGLEFSLHILHQPAVGVASEDGLLVVTQRNLQVETHRG